MNNHRYWRTLASLVFAALGLAACGGGGGSSTTATSTNSAAGGSQQVVLIPTSAASTVVQNIEYYGDSTIYGLPPFQEQGQVARPAPVTFAANLPAAARYNVRNEGISGTTACQLLNGTDDPNRHLPWPQQMQQSNAKFVIINHAINDARTDTVGSTETVYADCMRQLARVAKSAGKIVIFETPNVTDQSNGRLDNYVALMKQVAASENLRVIDQYEFTRAQAGTNLERLLEIVPDGTHPNQTWYDRKGQYAAQQFLTFAY